MNKWIFVGLSLWTSLLFAQNSDSLIRTQIPILKEIILSDDKLDQWAVGSSILSLDSALSYSHGKDLSTLLSSSSHIRIRSYGLGGLASSSIRGAGASHTLLQWNGVALNQSTTGQFDLTLIPTFFIDELDVQSGGLSSLMGEGAIGGSIHLNNTSEFNKGIKAQVHSTIGSFGNKMFGSKLQLSNEIIAFDIRLYNKNAINNFCYKDPFSNDDLKEQEHAGFISRGIQSSLAWGINENWKSIIRYWGQNTERDIAPSISEGFSVAQQKDKSDLFLFQIQFQKDSLVWNNSISYQYSSLIYEDSIKDISSRHFTYRYKISQDVQWKLNNNQMLRFETSILVDSVRSTNLNVVANNEFRSSTALNYSKKIQNKLLIAFGTRQEVFKEHISPFLPSIAFQLSSNPNFKLEGSWSRSYKNPTWNDLYWYPGGNVDLKEELGWMTNLKISTGSVNGDLKKNIALSCYFGRINNWIIWLPNSNASYWNPSNLARVEQKGVELEANVELETLKGTFRYENLFSCQLASDLNADTNSDKKHNQIIYVPIFQANHKLSWTQKNIRVFYQHHIESKRFTTTDNSSFLNQYLLAELGFQYSAKIKSKRFNVSLQLNNLFNIDYHLVNDRPMPGRHFNLSFNIYV
jgi:iron complex outermembrane receptor protein